MNRKRVAALVAVLLAAVGAGAAGAGLLAPDGCAHGHPGHRARPVDDRRPEQAAPDRRPQALRERAHDGRCRPPARLLSRSSAAGSWGVNIGFGAIVDSTNTASDSPPFYKNLVVTAPTTGPDANKVVLSGTATPSADTTINNVDTYLGECTGPPTAGCVSPASTQFTHKSLDGLNGDPAAVPVAAGQQVAVTVKLSFS